MQIILKSVMHSLLVVVVAVINILAYCANFGTEILIFLLFLCHYFGIFKI